jgi:hypothetical protein
MPGTAVVNSGNYDLKIATGFQVDAFVLDDPLKGILAGYTTTTTRTNLATNPSLETNATGWIVSGTGSTGVRSTLQYLFGTASIKWDYPSTLASPLLVYNPGAGSFRIPVVAGQTYTASVYLFTDNADDYRVDIRWATAVTGGTVTDTGGTSALITANTWTRYSATGSCPVGYSFAQVNIVRLTNTVTGTSYADGALFEQSSTLLPYFDGTYAEPYTGYTLTEQAWNGTANASTSTATWGLNSSYINSNYVLDGTTEFADVLDSTTSINVRRGRRDVGDQFSAGTMTFTIQDVDGIFNPFDQNSPFYDTPQSKPGLAPLREVRLIRYDDTDVPESLFSGYVVNYDYNFALGGLDTVTVYCADQFYLLAQTFLDTFNVNPETSGERIETVLDLPEVDFPAGARDIATGTVDLGSVGAYTVPEGTNVLQYLTQINETAEFGRLFMSRAGVLTFQERIGDTLSAPVAAFKDDGTGYKFDGVGISFEADSVVNRAVVSGLSGSSHTATDPASIATYFIQTVSITNSLLHNAGQIQAAAEYLLNPEPEPRYTSVATKYLMLTTAQKDTLATVDIGDTISVEKSFPSGTGTTQLAQELSVEGIEHRLDFSTGHSVLYSTAPTTIVYELILDDLIYGVLDAENVLG